MGAAARVVAEGAVSKCSTFCHVIATFLQAAGARGPPVTQARAVQVTSLRRTKEKSFRCNLRRCEHRISLSKERSTSSNLAANIMSTETSGMHNPAPAGNPKKRRAPLEHEVEVSYRLHL